MHRKTKQRTPKGCLKPNQKSILIIHNKEIQVMELLAEISRHVERKQVTFKPYSLYTDKFVKGSE